MRIYNSGFVNFTSNVMFDAEPQDITFLSSGAYYTLQSRFDLKQNLLTASTPASSTQLLVGTTLKALKAGTNITLTNDATSVTINGPVVSGFQNTLTASAPVGSHPILTGTTIKCLKTGTGITMVSDGTSVTVSGRDSYTKTEVNTSLALKADLGTPSFTGSVNIGGNLSIPTGDFSAGQNSSIYNSNDRLESAFSINNNKVNGFSTYYLNSTTVLGQTTQTGKLYTGQGVMDLISTTNHPLRLGSGVGQIPQVQLLATGTRDVEIKTPLIVRNLLDVHGIGYFFDDVTITGKLTVTGIIDNVSYSPSKPYVSLRVTTTGGTASTGTTIGTIGTPGTVSIANYGHRQDITVARGTAGATNNFLYTFSWTNPHPLGSNYAVMCNFQGSSSSNPSPNAFFRATGTSTSITVWVRTETGIIKDENFYVYTVP